MNTELRDDVDLQNYVLSLTEQDAINAHGNARAEARILCVRFNETAALQAYEQACTLMRDLLWIGPAVGTTTPASTYASRLKAGKPVLSLDNLKFCFWPSKASYNKGGCSR